MDEIYIGILIGVFAQAGLTALWIFLLVKFGILKLYWRSPTECKFKEIK